MAAPGPAQAPAYTARSPWYLFRIFMLVSAVCFFLAALAFGGHRTFDANGYEWLAAGFAAWAFAYAFP
jgi:hypothetical protein